MTVDDQAWGEPCWFCQGEKVLTPAQQAEWQRLQAMPICPVCQGTGGKRTWSWVETDEGTRKAFDVAVCLLCQGQRHVTPEQVEANELEKWRLRVWGVGCTVLAVGIGLCAVTQVLTLLIGRTPWAQCCTPPHLLFPAAAWLGYQGWRMWT